MNEQTTEVAVPELIAGNVKKVMAPHQVGSADVYMVKPEAIRLRDGFNSPRESDPNYPEHVRHIADLIKANGFRRDKPITVFASSDGFLYPSDGHTRYRAVMLANSEGAGIEAIPVISETKGTTEEDRIAGLITNNTGKPLTPYGEGLVIKQLINRGLDDKEISRRLGFPTPKINNLLALVAAPKEIRDMVVAGTVSATLAIDVLKKEGANAVKVLSEGAQAAAAAGKAKVTKKRLSEPKPKALHPDSAMLDWLERRRDVVIREWYREGQERFFLLTDSCDEKLAEGPTLRDAIKAAQASEE